MQSVRCFGETKFFRQCPRYICVPKDDQANPCFCWEHKDQREVRLEEVEMQRNNGHEDEWAPLGAYLTNRENITDAAPPQNPSRLRELASDEQNVHTAEVQLGVSGAIKRLREWSETNRIKTERDLATLIASTLYSEPDETESKALEHLSHCYQWNDDTRMFGTTYPQLASWVWARVDREHENRDLLRERFFEEVADSSGQCLNGNMARLLNVFAAIDLEMSPQEVCLSREQLQSLVAKAVDSSKTVDDALELVYELLERASVNFDERRGWIDCVREAFAP